MDVIKIFLVSLPSIIINAAFSVKLIGFEGFFPMIVAITLIAAVMVYKYNKKNEN